MRIKQLMRAIARNLSTFPILGRFVRIAIAIIRLPEERVQFRQMILEQSTRLQQEADALAHVRHRLERHEVFITSQVPRLAQLVAKINQDTSLARNDIEKQR